MRDSRNLGTTLQPSTVQISKDEAVIRVSTSDIAPDASGKSEKTVLLLIYSGKEPLQKDYFSGGGQHKEGIFKGKHVNFKWANCPP